jgi:hypothetical protein
MARHPQPVASSVNPEGHDVTPTGTQSSWPTRGEVPGRQSLGGRLEGSVVGVGFGLGCLWLGVVGGAEEHPVRNRAMAK